MVLKYKWQSVLEESTDFSTMLAMTVAHWKEMTVSQSKEMRACDVGVLINFVWIMHWETSFCSKWEFRNDICYLWLDLLLRNIRLLFILIICNCLYRRLSSWGLKRFWWLKLVSYPLSLWLMSLVASLKLLLQGWLKLVRVRDSLLGDWIRKWLLFCLRQIGSIIILVEIHFLNTLESLRCGSK